MEPKHVSMDDILILLSGGQDSTTCLFWAKERWPKSRLHALSASYGQRHSAELEAAKSIAELAGCASHHVVDLSSVFQGAGSALVDSAQELTSSGGLGDLEAPGGLPSSFVAGRNLVFLAAAAARAAIVRAGAIITGVCQADYSGYPDCRREFITAMYGAINAAMPSSMGRIDVLTPLMDLTKVGSIGLAMDMAAREAHRTHYPNAYPIPAWRRSKVWKAIGLSVTCYRGERPGCGECASCVIRDRAFKESGAVDPSRCNLDTDGDGNCHVHPKGCA